jgi:hypothetical protein
VIADIANATDDTAILELYAGSLVYLKDFATAFEAYKRLPLPDCRDSRKINMLR